jgi:hypothetical protein
LRQAQREIDSREFATWRAEYDLAPWGDIRDDQRAAVMVAAAGPAASGVAVPFNKALDLVNPWGKGIPESSLPDPETLAQKVRTFNLGLAGRRKRK